MNIHSARCYRLSKAAPLRRGTVLIIVLWIAAGLVTVALYFGHSMMLEYRAADNAVAGLEASQAIEGARRYVRFVLANLETPGQWPDVESYEAEQVPVGEAAFWLLGRGDETTAPRTPVFSLVDEASKLNLNTATLEMLEALPDMTAELAAAIMDWRDPDSEVSPGGAESQTYLLREPAYYCKDGAFETVEELRLVAGADWKVLYGEDANRNGILDPNEDDGEESFPDDNRDGILQPGLLEYVTVYSREPNRQEDGSERININNDDDEHLEALLEDTFGNERAQQIRQSVGGAGSRANFGSLLEYYIRSGMTPEEFSRIADSLSVTDDEFIEGRINVNTASETVLACLPGIGEEYANPLVAYRQGKMEELESIAWVAEVLDEGSAIEAGPYITTRSFQFTADLSAVGHQGKGLRRVLFVFDTSSGEPVVVYRRDLGRFGWPLGTEIRQSLTLLASSQERFQ
ncbi:MAG TPA: hypothetical protein ENN74_02475 [Firmicutes bacterium]|nr:hypothetical protein [Bacillota bacterium]